MLHRHGTDGAFYGHASVGCLHIRPVLNLKDPADVARMRRITEEVTDLVLEFGGTLSGEHGDGLARSEWNRKMFGPAVYEAFRQVKHAFDPHNLLNPGKVVDAPPMTENLRYGPGYRPAEPPTRVRLPQAGGLRPRRRDVQRLGRVPQDAGRDDVPVVPGDAATRRTARAAGPTRCGWRWRASEPLRRRLREPQWVHEVLDLCLMCKACKAECPSNVDVAKLKAEFLHVLLPTAGRGRSATC